MSLFVNCINRFERVIRQLFIQRKSMKHHQTKTQTMVFLIKNAKEELRLQALNQKFLMSYEKRFLKLRIQEMINCYKRKGMSKGRKQSNRSKIIEKNRIKQIRNPLSLLRKSKMKLQKLIKSMEQFNKATFDNEEYRREQQKQSKDIEGIYSRLRSNQRANTKKFPPAFQTATGRQMDGQNMGEQYMFIGESEESPRMLIEFTELE